MKRFVKLAKLSYHWLEGLLHKGDKVICPCCGRSYRSLRPLASGPGTCWVCFSYPRTRSFKLLLDKYLTDKQNVRFLHVAPEKTLLKWLSSDSRIDYTPCDKRMPGYSYPENVLNADITDLPFDDNSFDFLLCSHVLEHIKQDRRAISELFRVLKPGGDGIVQVPIDNSLTTTDEESDSENLTPQERAKRFGQFDHVKRYSRDFLDRLRQAGFIVQEKDFSLTDTTKYALGENEPVIMVSKPIK